MRPVRPWSWALLVVATITLCGFAAVGASASVRAERGATSHSVVRDGVLPGGEAVLVDRAPVGGVDRLAPRSAELGIAVLGLVLALAARWYGTTRLGPARGRSARRPGDVAGRAPPVLAS